MEVADARIDALVASYALKEVLKKTSSALSEIQAVHNQHKTASNTIIERLIIELEEAFMGAGLTEEQETMFIALVAQRG